MHYLVSISLLLSTCPASYDCRIEVDKSRQIQKQAVCFGNLNTEVILHSRFDHIVAPLYFNYLYETCTLCGMPSDHVLSACAFSE